MDFNNSAANDSDFAIFDDYVYKSRKHFNEKFEHIIRVAIDECIIHNDWHEDIITSTILRKLRNNFSSFTIESEQARGRYNVTEWEVYKNTNKNKLEYRYGDIGFLIKLDFGDGREVVGAATVEAKRIYNEEIDGGKYSTPSFGALKIDQLKRLFSSNVNHRTVFYDYIVNPENSSRLPISKILPTIHLITSKLKNRSVYKHTEDFSYCITHRFFQGYELNYSQNVIDDLRGARSDVSGTPYLVVANVSLNSKLGSTNMSLIDINHDIYRVIPRDDDKEEPLIATHTGN
ncbi:hypothetical protein P7M07_22305 [Vibrio parahaemolyticus]|nr:hypothetical protein [Vibrio parahaemolyticus]EID4334011.1 hypothetical protein [Vibrio parahaemolyticus]MDG2675766.1 hypothetical protein [Vibrio parahaemolyticus]